MGYGDIKDVPRRTTSDKIFLDKAFDIARNPKHDLDINVDLLQQSIIFFDKNTCGNGIKNENISKK